ncbi:MAG: hypothetical protein FJ315_09030, partial [SAR202 cluster bacterium]|nr:hypothetical protein [SAR202 cluster bacterium]
MLSRVDRSLSAPDTRSFSVWQSLLRRGKERESLEAVAGLAELGSPEALQELVWALEHRNSRVRSAARAALVRRGDLETALAVGTVLFHGPRGVRRTAEAVLAACGLPAAKAVLFPFLEDRRAVVRAEAA